MKRGLALRGSTVTCTYFAVRADGRIRERLALRIIIADMDTWLIKNGHGCVRERERPLEPDTANL